MKEFTAWKFKTAQFTVRLEFLNEEIEPDNWDDEELEDILNKIERGKLLYFCAKASVTWKGREIGSDYLGCCCYESVEDFKKNGYFRDMVLNATKEARQYFKDLALPKLRAA
jgi:hypothetical protein